MTPRSSNNRKKGVEMNKRLVTDQDEIFKLILADTAFTEAVDRDDQGVYIMGADGSKRYITQLQVENDEEQS